MSSASATSSAAFQNAGGSINKNSPGIWIAVIVAVVILGVVWMKRK